MLACGFVLFELWDRELTERQKKSLTQSLGLDDMETARNIWGLLAGVSRVGEANPGRMHDFGSGRPVTREQGRTTVWEEERKAWWEEAGAAGLPLPPLDHRHPYRTAPKYITAATLPRLLGCDCTDVANGECCPKHRRLFTVAMALHDDAGNTLNFDHVNRSHGAAGGADWDRVRAALVTLVSGYIGIDIRRSPELLRAPQASLLSSASRLISRCNKKVARALYTDPADFVSPDDPVEVWASDLRRQASETVFG
jgi:hypothetical protein